MVNLIFTLEKSGVGATAPGEGVAKKREAVVARGRLSPFSERFLLFSILSNFIAKQLQFFSLKSLILLIFAEICGILFFRGIPYA